jgi:Ni2+-binding GTPase involved in maturation of urease and hydrogenase
MKLVTVAGPPSSGKTAVIVKAVQCLQAEGLAVGIIKFDCLSAPDQDIYRKMGLPVQVGLSGNLCPDHFYVTNIDDALRWGCRQGLDMLISESAGLCNRCSPHIKGVLAICVIDCLAGVNTPQKTGPMLRLADMVVITKGEIVSQAEREVFSFRVKQANPKAVISFVNGITGQGVFDVAIRWKAAAEVDDLEGRRIRFSMSAAICPYCVGGKLPSARIISEAMSKKSILGEWSREPAINRHPHR